MDVLALGVSLLAMRLAVRRPTPRFTFGLRRAEPVAAIFSAVLVLATTVGIVVEGVEALRRTGAAARRESCSSSRSMALVVNGLSAWLLHDAIGHAHPHAHDADNPDDHGNDVDRGTTMRTPRSPARTSDDTATGTTTAATTLLARARRTATR